MKNKYKVAGYLRLSVEDGDKEVSDSIVSQKSIIEEKIKQLGNDFELYDLYSIFCLLRSQITFNNYSMDNFTTILKIILEEFEKALLAL